MNIYIVTPVWNEEKRIEKVLNDLLKINLKIIVVNDGSIDSSQQKIKKIKSKNLVLLDHKINLGKSAALKTGCEYAFSDGADAVILMDSDGQHSVNDIPAFIEKLEVVLGSRNLGMGVPFVRYVGNKLASVLVNILFGIYVSDLLSGFRALTRKGYQKVKWNPSRPPGYGVETEMIIRVKRFRATYCEIPVATIYYDNYKGVSILDAVSLLKDVLTWRFKL